MIYAERAEKTLEKPQANKTSDFSQQPGPIRSPRNAKSEERHKDHYPTDGGPLMRVIRGARNSTSTSFGAQAPIRTRVKTHLNDDVENINFDICKLLFSEPGLVAGLFFLTWFLF